MVQPINIQDQQNKNHHPKGLVIEFVGLAGVGKSTLTSHLKNNIPWITQERPPKVWKISSIPFYLKNILSITPTLINVAIENPLKVKRRDVAFMALLNGWYEILRKKAESTDKVIIIDQGAVSCMAYLQLWSPYYVQTTGTHKWWSNIYMQWAQTIDMVVWLYAPYSVLLNRINMRKQNHGLKNVAEDKAKDLLKTYYSKYAGILDYLCQSDPNFRIFKVNSYKNSVEDIADIFTTKIISEYLQ